VATAKRSVAAAIFVSNNVCDGAGMGGLGQNEFGWALSMRFTVSGLGCGLAVVCEYVSSLRRLYVDPWRIDC
jgi:hypothetical protein